MLQNDYLVAKIGVDTAENEPYVKSDVSWRGAPDTEVVMDN